MKRILSVFSHENKSFQAIALACCGWACFSMNDALAKWLSQTYAVAQILAMINMIGLVFIGIWLWRGSGLKGLRSRALKWHVIRACTITATSYTVISAFHLIPMADVYGIVFLMPFIVSILSYFMLGEKFGLHRLMAIIIGFCGVLVLAGPKFDTGGAGVLFAFAGAFFASWNAIAIRKIGRNDPQVLFAFYPMLAGALFNLPGMAAHYTPVTLPDFCMMVALTVFLLSGLLLLAQGFARAPETGVVTPFHYTQMVWGILLGYLMFGDLPDRWTLLGAALIIGSGLYVIWREHVAHQAKKNIPRGRSA